MGQIAFWSGRHGQTGNSANMIAASSILGIEYVTRTLICHTQWEMSSLESTFLKDKKSSENIEYTRKGIDALELLAKSDKLAPTAVKDYTDTILKDRLELLRGTSKPNEEMFNSVLDVIQTILAAAKNYYNLTLVDVNSGIKNKFSNVVLESSDLVVVSLNQNRVVLEEFFNSPPPFLEDKTYVIVLGQYDRHSKYSLSNISRMFKPKVPIFTVPHCTGFMDSLNDKTVIEFFLRNKNITNSHDNYYFMSEVRRFSKGILDAVGLDTKIFSEKGA